ncbi:hypothetical protein [Prescottella equi]|uniref:Uncharacterized protein n=1 Tax=Rhodococcus hoagii TaxID=43767 RepID=A0AAP2AKT8_RHOHA|nr:hypothetical protein [Prescottella equi]MBM4626672.1 hypothetical protein [Prescottella equi]NKV08604.1 hypothetical protein [Prescottella equi]BDC71063.1 hypothetical protein KAREA_09780 [Prescottella equi]
MPQTWGVVQRDELGEPLVRVDRVFSTRSEAEECMKTVTGALNVIRIDWVGP